MKKTLMVLSFALCASFAFAQVKTAERVSMRQDNVVSLKADATPQADYKASIFTKSETLRTWDFSVANDGYTLGKITPTTRTIGGEQVSIHTGNQAFGEWNRIASNDSATLAQAANTFSALNQWMGGMYDFLSNNVDSGDATLSNGFLLMSLLGATRGSGAVYNAYVSFDAVDMSATGVYDVQFYQLYYKFYDNCYLDYSSNNGSTWNTMEINKTGVDININEWGWGTTAYTLPAAACSDSTKVRLRYFSNGLFNNSQYIDYAYFWLLDDVAIIRGDNNRWKTYGQTYGEGAYQLMPKGLELPLYWYSSINNNGTISQNNVTVNMYERPIDLSDSTLIDTYNNGNIAPTTTTTVMVDGMGYNTGEAGAEGWYLYSNGIQRGNRGGVPTDVEGEHYVQAQVISDSNAFYFRPILYTVNQNAEDTSAIWGHDNGVLVNHSHYTFGHVAETTVGDDADCYMDAGYQVSLRYTTGDTIPVDENGNPWVIRGVQYVVATTNGKISGTNTISPLLSYDAYNTEDSTLSFESITTGVNTVAVVTSEQTDSTTILDEGGFMTFGEYNTVNVEFPMQPELQSHTSYRLGYRLMEDGVFSLASSAGSSYYVRDASTTSGLKRAYFSGDSTTNQYATSFVTSGKCPNIYDARVYDGVGGSIWSGYYTDYYPMIRMIVGPRRDIAQYTITAECEFEDDDTTYGAIFDNDALYACGTEYQYAQGSSLVYYIQASENCAVENIWIDGQAIDMENDPNIVAYEGYYVYAFNNIAENHSIKARFKFDETGIDRAAANVHMNLQPNPATSQVNLSIEGVNGMVNCSLVDMSGRVVYNANINAENTQTINVSNLAKGAYFVRITNNDFTKIEKLIVR